MGYGSWSTDLYRDRAEERKRTNTPDFAYHEVTRNAPRSEQKCHPQMDPKGVIRESRDSDDHPESLAIAIFLDQTGSMHDTPITMQGALPNLMSDLIAGGCAHPQVLFGAVGDATTGNGREVAPLQVGQFESNVEMDEDLRRIYMEGGGGGSQEESYQLALYFAARHTAIDCFEKRGEKGYLFLIGDEKPYPRVSKEEVKRLFGEDIQDDIPIKDIVREAKEKWHIYFVIPAGTSHANSAFLSECWESLLGREFVLRLPDVSHVCGTITSTVTGEKPVSKQGRKRGTTRL